MAFAEPYGVRRSLPRAWNCLSPGARNCCVPQAERGIGAANWTVLLRAMGGEAVVRRYRRELLAMFADLRELSGSAERELWESVGDIAVEFGDAIRKAR